MTLRKKVTTVGNSAAIILSRDLLELLGLEIGQEVELSIMGRTLVVRSVQEAGRAEMVRRTGDRVLERRRGLFIRLAEATDTRDVGTD
jgi:antitoxin component of MazEF toxin-antitoxin module